MASVRQRKKELQKKIHRLKKYERRLIKGEKQRHIWMRRLGRRKLKEIREKRAMERRKRVLSRRETAKLNRTLRRRRKR